MAEEIGVSKTAVYDKLNRLEPRVSRALVKSTAQDIATIVHQLGGGFPELLPGYRVKILALQWTRSHRASTGSAAKHLSRSLTGKIFSRRRPSTGAGPRYLPL